MPTGQTDRQWTPDHYIVLSTMDAANIIIRLALQAAKTERIQDVNRIVIAIITHS